MTLRLTDKLIAPSRGSVSAALAYGVSRNAKRQDFLAEYLAELWRLCQKYGFDFSILVAQSVNETASWTSAVWQAYGNPAGIGVTGTDTSAGTNYSLVYKNGTDAARAHVVHMFAYVKGGFGPNVDLELRNYVQLDPRWNAVFQAKYDGTIRTIADFNVNGRWALLNNSRYGDNIIQSGRAVWPNLPDQGDPPVTTPSTPAEPVEQEPPPVATYNYGNGVLPSIEKIAVSEGNKFAGYINPADHIIRAFVIHSAYGSLEGTTSYFQQGNALTDYMVGNSSDGSSLDGRLRQFNDPNGARYSWASGPVSNPIEDAAKFLEIYGPNKEVVNMYTTALERSGDSRNAVTEKEHAKRIALIAYWANRYGKYLKDKTGEDRFTCDTFPLIPSENNRSFLIYHGEINSDKRTSCPDSAVRATIDRIVADVRALLGSWQRSGVPIPPAPDDPDPQAQYAEPKPVAELQAYKDKDAAPSFVKVGNDTFVFVNDRVRATKNTPRYQTAKVDGAKIGADIKKGEEFAVLWLFFDEKGTGWFVTPWWSRVLADDTQRIKDAA